MAGVMPRAEQPLSWADIPWDLAGMVLSRLRSYVDRARFAAVCSQWRAASQQPALALPPPLPLLALPSGTFKSAAGGSWLFFPRRKCCLLLNHFTGATMRLPVLPSIENIKGWNPDKLIVCSPNLVDAFINTAVASQILVCQPGASSCSAQAYDNKRFQDMAFYQGKLYLLDHMETLLVVDIIQDPSSGNPQVSQIRQVIEGKTIVFHIWKHYLVESGGSLLMVHRKVRGNISGLTLVIERTEFQVLVADLEHSQWVNVTTLGDGQWLFLGRWCSRALSVSQYGKPGDLICFMGYVTENADEDVRDK